MNIQQLKKEIIDRNEKVEKNIKKDMAFQVAKNILEARLKMGYTQEKLAKIMKTKQPSLARAEGGSTLPSMSFLNKIAKALKTELIPPTFSSIMKKTETEYISMYTSADFPTTYKTNSKDTYEAKFVLENNLISPQVNK